jgi:signal transduction histidine kinase
MSSIFTTEQKNPTTRAVSDLRLGLNIAQTIVKLHGGQISIDSEASGGTRNGFKIPRVVKDLNQAA